MIMSSHVNIQVSLCVSQPTPERSGWAIPFIAMLEAYNKYDMIICSAINLFL